MCVEMGTLLRVERHIIARRYTYRAVRPNGEGHSPSSGMAEANTPSGS